MKTYRVYMFEDDYVDIQAECFDINAKDDHLELIYWNEEGIEEFVAVFKCNAWKYIIELDAKQPKKDEKKAKK